MHKCIEGASVHGGRQDQSSSDSCVGTFRTSATKSPRATSADSPWSSAVQSTTCGGRANSPGELLYSHLSSTRVGGAYGLLGSYPGADARLPAHKSARR